MPRTADDAANGSSPSHIRNMSSSSTRRAEYFALPSSLQQQQPQTLSQSPLNSRKYGESKRAVQSELSCSDASSPPPIFDMPLPTSTGGVSDDSPVIGSPEDAWAEPKVRIVDPGYAASSLIIVLACSRISKRKQKQSCTRSKVSYQASAAQRRRPH
jgi:hypothetical protein